MLVVPNPPKAGVADELVVEVNGDAPPKLKAIITGVKLQFSSNPPTFVFTAILFLSSNRRALIPLS